MVYVNAQLLYAQDKSFVVYYVSVMCKDSSSFLLKIASPKPVGQS